MDKVKLKHLRSNSTAGIKDSKFQSDVIPAWIADMNFDIAPAIKAGLIEMVENSVCGYPQSPYDLSLHEIFKSYVCKRFDWRIKSKNVSFLKDVVQGICRCIYSFTDVNDHILIQPPVYQPFHNLVKLTDRRLLLNPLMKIDNRYQIDFTDFESKAKKAKLFIFCNPQNPTGRVYSRHELTRLAEICVANNLIVVSDEIHADLVLESKPHIPLSSVNLDIAERTITLMSASKAYNIAGTSLAFAYLPNEKLQKLFNAKAEAIYGNHNILALHAVKIAMTEGESWLKKILAILRGNRLFLEKYILENWVNVDYLPGEGTYLAWLDCRKIQGSSMLSSKLLAQSRVAVTDGSDFGYGGQGFIRLNFARNRDELISVIKRMDKVMKAN